MLLLSPCHRADHLHDFSITTVQCVHNADMLNKARFITQAQCNEIEQSVISLQRSNFVHSLKIEIQNF